MYLVGLAHQPADRLLPAVTKLIVPAVTMRTTNAVPGGRPASWASSRRAPPGSVGSMVVVTAHKATRLVTPAASGQPLADRARWAVFVRHLLGQLASHERAVPAHRAGHHLA